MPPRARARTRPVRDLRLGRIVSLRRCSIATAPRLDAVVSPEGCLVVLAQSRGSLPMPYRPCSETYNTSAEGQSLARAVDDGRDQPAVRGELLDQWRRDIGARRGDADAS